jgi:hypothetical protein
VCGYTFAQRRRHYFQEMSGVPSPKTDEDMQYWEYAWKTAMEEMIDEQHIMLRVLLIHFGLIKAE